MKKFMMLPVLALLSIVANAGTTKTTTTKSYSSETAPMTESQRSDTQVPDSIIEAEEYDRPLSPDSVDQTKWEEKQEMEERNQKSSSVLESEDAIDYKDRTRTDRERKALNTGGDASDDQ